MKIISVDNYNRENVSDVLVAENLNPYYANYITNLLNKDQGANSFNFYRAVPDDHKLYKWEP